MDTIIYLNFEWDRAKAKLNKIKHGISFKAAAKIFNDPNRLEEYDYAHSWDEERWQVTGMADDVLFVVYTERHERIRLISAREATEDERRRYYGRFRVLHNEIGDTVDAGGKS